MTNCLFHHGIQAVTGELRVRFLKPVPCGTTIEIQAWLANKTPPLFRLKSEVRLNADRLAWGEGKFMQTDRPA